MGNQQSSKAPAPRSNSSSLNLTDVVQADAGEDTNTVSHLAPTTYAPDNVKKSLEKTWKRNVVQFPGGSNSRRRVTLHDDFVTLFEEISKKKQDGLSYQAVREEYEETPYADAIIRCIFGRPDPEYVIKYRVPKANKAENMSPRDLKRAEELERIEHHNQELRDDFETALINGGLIVENEPDQVEEDVFYIKLWAPFCVLLQEAQFVSLPMPLTVPVEIQKLTEMDSASLLKRFNPFSGEAVKSSLVSHKLEFTANFLCDRFLAFQPASITDPRQRHAVIQDVFFSRRQVLLLVSSILAETTIADRQKHNLYRSGYRDLLNSKTFEAVYPLHDGDYDANSPDAVLAGKLANPEYQQSSLREWLNIHWVRKFFTYQPLTEIKEYFGEKYALYFAFLGFYNSWLVVTTLLGIFCFLYGIGVQYKAEDGDDTSIVDKVVSFASDNGVTPYMAFIVAIWGTVMLEYWKRKQHNLAFQWSTESYEKREHARAEFRPTKYRLSPVTGKIEPYYPQNVRRVKILVGLTVVALSILIVLISVGCTVVFRAWTNATSNPLSGSYAGSAVAAVFSVVVMIILQFIYYRISKALTDWENHRTETQYDDALILKNFLFDFCNNYSALFYVAFFRAYLGCNILGNPDLRDGCADGADPNALVKEAMTDLFIQLAITLGGKQFFFQIVEVGMPWLNHKLRLRTAAKRIESMNQGQVDQEGVPEEKIRKRWEEDGKLEDPGNVGQEYQEMIVQFGFITLLVVGFPLGPLFALANNIIEVRSDAWKLITQYRRPAPIRAQDIGSWYIILEALSFISIFSNGVLIALNSNIINSEYLSGISDNLAKKVLFILVFQNVVLIVKWLAAYIIPDVDEETLLGRRRRRYIENITIDNDLDFIDDGDD